MTIDCHFIAWNEAETIHLTIKHYQAFCRHVYVYDNYSDDNTREIAVSMGCEVKLFGVPGQLNDHEYLKVKNHKWKGSDADWVIVCDADEILWVEKSDFERFDGTILRTSGYNVFSNHLPNKSWLEINTVVPDDNYSKLVCFKPQAIKDIGYVYGCHEAKPTGKVEYCSVTAKLLHYKHVGGAQRLADRHALYASRLSEINKRWKLGYQYEEPRQETIDYFNENLAKAKPLW